MTGDTVQIVAELFFTLSPRLKRLVTGQLGDRLEDEIANSYVRTIGKLVDNPATLGELAERCEITRQGASLQVQYLVEHGWVRRIPDPNDRRSALLEVTDEGLTHWIAARRTKINYLAAILSQLTPEELAGMEAAFLGLQRVLDEADGTKGVE